MAPLNPKAVEEPPVPQPKSKIDFPERFVNCLRRGIKFFFHKAGVQIPKMYEQFSNLPIAAELDVLQEYIQPGITERSGIITSRVGQGAYRKGIILRWEYQCAVTGFNKPEILIASHIVPW